MPDRRVYTLVCVLFTIWLGWIGRAGEAFAGPLQLVKAPVLPVDPATKTGNTTIYVKNTGKEPIGVVLSVGDIKSITSGREIDAQITLGAPDDTKGKPFYRETVASDGVLPVIVSVANAWEAGEAMAPILNHGTEIGTLRLTNYRPPFNVHLEPTDSTLVFRYPEEGDEGAAKQGFILKNDDAVTYPVNWRLSIGSQVETGTIQLPPNSSRQVIFKPPTGWFSSWPQGLFKKDVREGLLSLSFAPPGRGDDPSLPARTVGIKASLVPRLPELQQAAGPAILLVVLALGGIVSLLLSHGIPNRLKRLDLRDRFDRLAARTRSLSSRIDSHLRVQLRVERRNLGEELRVSWALSPDFADTFERLSRGLDSLERRVGLLNQIDELFDRLEASTTSTFVPSLLDQVIAVLVEAKGKLGRADATDAELQASQALITEAAALLKKHGTFDLSAAQDLAQRLDAASKDFMEGGSLKATATLNRLQPKIANLLARSLAVAGKPQAINAHNYPALDADLAKLLVLSDYIRLFEDASPLEQKRLTDEIDGKSREGLLLEELAQNSWEGLTWARVMVRQVRDKIYKTDIVEAIQAGEFSIQFEPTSIYAHDDVKLQVRFNKSWFNSAAALEKLGCNWDFGHSGFTEKGWRVCHYFPEEVGRKVTVTVGFENEAGQLIKDATGQPVRKTCDIEIAPRKKTSWFGDRTQLEVARLSVVLLAAVLGLLAGAQEQLQKLDLLPGLVAVFLIGFGADTLKNLLVRSQG